MDNPADLQQEVKQQAAGEKPDTAKPHGQENSLRKNVHPESTGAPPPPLSQPEASRRRRTSRQSSALQSEDGTRLR